MKQLDITVVGTPAPQGSKRHVGNGVMIESSKKVKPWRQDVKAAAMDAMSRTFVVGTHYPFTGPVAVTLTFYLPRPSGHFRTGKHAGDLKPGAPEYVAKRPDVDKLIRSTFDALGEAGVWRDDSQVAYLNVAKFYAASRAGAAITVTELAVEDGAA